jgi:hypothetical protein
MNLGAVRLIYTLLVLVTAVWGCTFAVAHFRII